MSSNSGKIAQNKLEEAEIISEFTNIVRELKTLDSTNAHLNDTLVAFMTSRMTWHTAEQWETYLSSHPDLEGFQMFEEFCNFLSRNRQKYTKLKVP